jgi:tetratricopeptide (TPR) repeat protein
MTDVFRDQLQSSLGTNCTLERELGGGGMSRVFVARDEHLGRQIVVKVLAPELSAELSTERFAREIRLAAQLRHPNIVPLLTAGGDAAIEAYEQACTLTARNAIPLAGLSIAHARLGARDRAETFLNELIARHDDQHPTSTWIAYALAWIGRRDEAMAWLERAAEAREFWMAWMYADGFSDPFKGDAAFEALVRRIGVPMSTEPLVVRS